MMQLREVEERLRAIIEASVYVAPTEPQLGLTVAEIREVGRRLGLKDGEIGDALPRVTGPTYGGRRVMLPTPFWEHSGQLIFAEDPDLRNPEAFDFVFTQLNELVRAVGTGRASISRSVVVERAVAQSISRNDIELAITLLILAGRLTQQDSGDLRFTHAQGGVLPLPSDVRKSHGANLIPISKAHRTSVIAHVADVVSRRSDGRPKSAEPFDAFAEQLERLGYGHFRLWWNQTVTELRRAEPVEMPISVVVLSAALIEGSLSFIVKHARELGVPAFASSDFDRPASSWRIDDLVASAARGEAAAVLQPQTRTRADHVVVTRRRIHAGRMLVDFPDGISDLRPEEARDAIAAAEQVVRAVVDWLEKHPAAP